MTYEELAPLYDQFLDSLCGWRIYLCDRCGYGYTHPGNYCGKCPGKLHQIRMTWGQYADLSRKQTRLISAYEREFIGWLRGRGIEATYDQVSDSCYQRLYELRRQQS